MVGIALKKLAGESALKVDSGYVYGSMNGLPVCLEEGMGYKSISFYFKNDDAEKRYKLEDFITGVKKKYSIIEAQLTAERATLKFLDSYGTMGRIKSFINDFTDALEAVGIVREWVCSECGEKVENDAKFLIYRGNVRFGHKNCLVDSIEKSDGSAEAGSSAEHKQSTARGVLGAFLGMLVGIVPWVLLYMAGWIAGIIGYFIGLLTKKGYELLGGKKSGAKLKIIVIFTFLGVIIAQFVCLMLAVYNVFTADNYIPSLGEVFDLALYNLTDNPEFAQGFFRDLLVGLLFAAMSCYTFFKQIGKEIESDSTKIKLLDI